MRRLAYGQTAVFHADIRLLPGGQFIFQRKMIRFFNGNISIIHPDIYPCERIQLIDFIRLHGGAVGLVAYQRRIDHKPVSRFIKYLFWLLKKYAGSRRLYRPAYLKTAAFLLALSPEA